MPAGYGGYSRRLAHALVPGLVRHRRVVLGAALVLFVLGTVFSVRLYANLRSGFEELLPDTAPSVAAARTLGPKLYSVSTLSVVITGEDGDAIARLADDLAPRLRKLPPTVVRAVDYRVDEETAFLRKFGGFYLSLEDLDTVQGRIDRRIAWEKQKANPMRDLLGDEEDAGPAPPLDFSDIEARVSRAGGSVARFRNGYYQTPDGRILVLLVRPPLSATNLESNLAVLDAVKRELAALHPERYDPKIQIGYGGEVATIVEEQEALAADLLSSAVVVLALTLAVLWFYFRRWSAILSIAGALSVGCALTFGLSWFLVGYLNTNTAFLGSIVIGNGINVSIIVVARYLEERRRGRGVLEANEEAFAGTLAATFVASFGAGLSYLSLAVTDFRGFSQFGIIGGLGMALCWVTAYLLLPPLLAALDAMRTGEKVEVRDSLIGRFVSWLNGTHPKRILAVTGLLTALSLAGIASYRGDLVEYDLRKLRAAKSEREGAQFWGTKQDQVFQTYLTPLVVVGETPAELAKVVAELDRDRAALGAADPIREVRTLDTVVPKDQEAKVARLDRLRDTLTDARLARLEPELRAKVLALRPPPDVRPITVEDLPAIIRQPLTERDGTRGRIALAFPRHVGTLTPVEMRSLTELLRGAIDRSGARAQALGQPMLFIDIADAILRDGPIATLLAFGAVVVLVLLSMRSLRASALVLGSLLLGVLWLLGIAGATRVRLNFLNFVTLPITFGIGVDYAVNIVQRWRAEGRGSLSRVLRETGGAVGLCSLTTVIGYGSLLVAQNRGLQGFGALASVGELACVSAALVALPAWLLRRKGGAAV
ncbi:MAG: MMPL family transporter [Anaeromyxobacter sp.]